MKDVFDKLAEAPDEESFKAILAAHSPKSSDLIDIDEVVRVCRVSKSTVYELFPVIGGRKGQFELKVILDVLRELNRDAQRLWPGIDVTGKPARFMTPLDVAALSGKFVDTDRLSRWRQAGTGPEFVRLSSKTVRYTPEAVSEWLVEESHDPMSLVGH